MITVPGETSPTDSHWFGAVFDAHYEEIHRYIGRRLDLDVAEDLAAETFLIAFRRRDRFDPARGAPRPWLYGIATNLIGRHRRLELRRYRALARTGPPPDDDGPEQRVVDRVTAGVTAGRLAGALARLSRGERDAVLLAAYGGFTYDEIAEALGVAAGTVASRLSRARTKLRDFLGVEA
ncbi:RNA polymerase sigma-70 factor (ECF subfamily) [Streptosporangium becharense]|uniref:RNA polymerase sigma-70 factor (ECF subfamily) n=1 Tax=Streptosporangium becharense TaxID=1816182 RepID=A0A7W9IFD1_9ACTN|nr:RNA polymerase sigma factor [Streptosporangium becharense]MBB2909532.1 RNA polymerase sigma-70 factor (ECF subfamily) [Streptosporangium becharense]MBB5819511.1 RNA polymerase sigma-70 factor (ECF subfamily) [Streptosporangium becharense]